MTWGPNLKSYHYLAMFVNCTYLSSSVHLHTHCYGIVIQAHLHKGQWITQIVALRWYGTSIDIKVDLSSL